MNKFVVDEESKPKRVIAISFLTLSLFLNLSFFCVWMVKIYLCNKAKESSRVTNTDMPLREILHAKGFIVLSADDLRKEQIAFHAIHPKGGSFFFLDEVDGKRIFRIEAGGVELTFIENDMKIDTSLELCLIAKRKDDLKPVLLKADVDGMFIPN